MVEVVQTCEREAVDDKGAKVKQIVQVRKLIKYTLKPVIHEKFNYQDEKDLKPMENEQIRPSWNKKKMKKMLIKADEDIYELTSHKKKVEENLTKYRLFLENKAEFPTESEPYRPKMQYRREGYAIKVSNIDEEYGEDDLINLFQKYGDIRNVFFPIPKYADKQKEKKRHYGFAIVSFYDINVVPKIMAEKDEFILGNIILNLTKK